jgi:hypothetical protein
MTDDRPTSLNGYLWQPGKAADPFQLDHDQALGHEVLFSNAVSGPRVVVADSVSYGAGRLTNDDVLLAASCSRSVAGFAA